ncbi:MAG TPA: hypothetical protein VMG08_02715 [Allosphingosinicella sp.]|nr:hypothetical protein [Allosphingosinicella sp.]
MTRRPVLFAPFLALGLLAGCAGQLRDYVGPRASVIRPQLIRYGFSLPEIACVGDRLGETLRPRQLRFLYRAASHVQQPFYSPERFTPRDFVWAAGSMRDPLVEAEINRAYRTCNVQLAPQIVAVSAPSPAGVTAGALPPPSGGPVPGVLPPPSGGPAPGAAAARPSVWLNLGAAPSGQAIAVDGASLEQEENSRTAWFRMIDPPPAGQNRNAYRLRIDCGTRIIRPLAHRLYDEAGAVAQERIYAEEEQLQSPVEGGTVTEIAYLSLCT